MPLSPVHSRNLPTIHSSLAFIFFLLLLTAGCRTNPEPVAEAIVPPPPPPQTLAPGQTVLSEFPSDGEWHSSGYLARPGDLLKFRPLAEATHLEPASLQMHIGRSVTQQVVSPSAQLVTLLGEIKFRVDKERAADFHPASIQIEISNLRAPE
jgi:hypothetical protein